MHNAMESQPGHFRSRTALCWLSLAISLCACDWPATAPQNPNRAQPCDPLEIKSRALPLEDAREVALMHLEPDTEERHFQVFLEYDGEYRLFTFDLQQEAWQELSIEDVLVHDPKEFHKTTYLTYLNLKDERSVLAYKFEPHLEWAGFATTDQEIESIQALQAQSDYISLRRNLKVLVPTAHDSTTALFPRTLRFFGTFEQDQKLVVVDTIDELPGLYVGAGKTLQGAQELKVKKTNKGQTLQFRFLYEGKAATLELPASSEAAGSGARAQSAPSLNIDGTAVKLGKTEFQPEPSRIEGLEFRYCERAQR